MLIGCFFAGEYLVPAVLPPGWTAEAFSREAAAGRPGSRLEEFKLRRIEATVSEGLEEYFAVKGTYPFTLEVLAVRKFVTRDTISRVHQAGIVYRMGENGRTYELARE
jgi:hypothetical protein